MGEIEIVHEVSVELYLLLYGDLSLLVSDHHHHILIQAMKFLLR